MYEKHKKQSVASNVKKECIDEEAYERPQMGKITSREQNTVVVVKD